MVNLRLKPGKMTLIFIFPEKNAALIIIKMVLKMLHFQQIVQPSGDLSAAFDIIQRCVPTCRRLGFFFSLMAGGCSTPSHL